MSTLVFKRGEPLLMSTLANMPLVASRKAVQPAAPSAAQNKVQPAAPSAAQKVSLPDSIKLVDDIDAAIAILNDDSTSTVNTVVVERAAAVVPAKVWDGVAAPSKFVLVLPDPVDDAASARKALEVALAARMDGLGAGHGAALAARVVELAAGFARCLGGRSIRAKLSVGAQGVKRDVQPCPKFHADTVPMRLIATLVGPGTQVLGDDAVAHVAESGPTVVRDGYAPYDAAAGDAVILVGRLGAGGARRPGVHRSPPPPCDCCDDARRVVLVLDADDEAVFGKPDVFKARD